MIRRVKIWNERNPPGSVFLDLPILPRLEVAKIRDDQEAIAAGRIDPELEHRLLLLAPLGHPDRRDDPVLGVQSVLLQELIGSDAARVRKRLARDRRIFARLGNPGRIGSCGSAAGVLDSCAPQPLTERGLPDLKLGSDGTLGGARLGEQLPCPLDDGAFSDRRIAPAVRMLRQPNPPRSAIMALNQPIRPIKL